VAVDDRPDHHTAPPGHMVDGAAAIDDHRRERQIERWSMGRETLMFVGSELAGRRAAMLMSPVQSVRPHRHALGVRLRDVLQWLPTQLNSRIEGLLPLQWRPAGTEKSTS